MTNLKPMSVCKPMSVSNALEEQGQALSLFFPPSYQLKLRHGSNQSDHIDEVNILRKTSTKTEGFWVPDAVKASNPPWPIYAFPVM